MDLLRFMVVPISALLLVGSGPGLARLEAASCGYLAPEDSSPQREFVEVTNQFFVRNVRIAPHSSGVIVTGELYNGRQGFFSPPLFKMQLFNLDCKYVGGNNFSSDALKYRSTRPFNVIVPRVEFSGVVYYYIEFLRGGH